MLRLSFALLVLLGCSDDHDPPEDAGRDTAVLSDVGRDTSDSGDDGGTEVDSGSDAQTDVGADSAVADVGVDSGTDAGTDVGVDAGTDSGVIPPGECNLASPSCESLCIRPVSCVRECGGPATECGCCSCAAGSIDDITCPPTS